MFNFPSAPAANEIWTSPDTGLAFKWNSYAWLPQPPLVEPPATPATLLQVVRGFCYGGLCPAEKQVGEARVIVRSATSRLIVMAGCTLALYDVVSAATSFHAYLKIRANGATEIAKVGSTNDGEYHSYQSVICNGSFIHASPVGTVFVIGIYADAYHALDECQWPWMYVQEVEL